MTQFKNPRSFAAMAKELHVPRQRIYNLSKKYKFLEPVTINGTKVFTAKQVSIIMDAVTYVNTARGVRLRFDFV